MAQGGQSLGRQGRVSMPMTYESMMTFAENWVAAWNRRDVDAVLAHFSDEAQFVSPVARNLVGRSVLRNKKELSECWQAALAASRRWSSSSTTPPGTRGGAN